MSRTGAVLAYSLTGLHDSMCVFFAIGRWQLPELAPQNSGFKIVFETMMRAPVERCAYAKFPIVFRERVRGKSKMSFGLALGFFLR